MFVHISFLEVSQIQKNEQLNQIFYDIFSFPDIDLFATKLNAQIDKFVSLVFDSDYFDTDAVSFNWTNFTPDICSSFRLIGKIMDKSMLDRCNRGSYHYSSLENTVLISIIEPNLISIPTRLSRHKTLPTMSHTREFHPLVMKLLLIVSQTL